MPEETTKKKLPPPPFALKRRQTHHNESVPLNGTMMQYFEWHVPADQKHWARLKDAATDLSEHGITAVWIPPPTKGSGPSDVGYAVYDLWDLGEFDQKGCIPTKYGTKDQLKDAIQTVKSKGINVYADAVLNHKLGADETETFKAVEVARDNTEHEISGEQEVKGWTKFTFPGRGEKYSALQWRHFHFTGIDFNAANKRQGIYRILGDGKYWSDHVDDENGNYDYLMGADIDTAHPEVDKDLKDWAVWVTKELGLSGFRLDAVKHIDAHFMADLLEHVRKNTELGNNLFAVAEYWKNSMKDLEEYLDVHNWKLSLFDVPFHFNLAEASQKGKDYDMRKIFDGTLVQAHPMHAVTFVNNHDTQPGESLASWVLHWFQPLAYALTLLRRDGYPCVFYGDIYGIGGENPVPASAAPAIRNIMKARVHFAYGDQDDYFDHPQTIGWVRRGEPGHLAGLAVVLCAGEEGSKRMFVGEDRSGEEWVDIAGGRKEIVVIDDEGFGDFCCNGGSASAWLRRAEAEKTFSWIREELAASSESS
ncbi:Maltohexaose-producing amylase [Phlyctochytrium arcticum]|nr:Maltohexaose-producing amylase [Phlyctochytrium arcticum]